MPPPPPMTSVGPLNLAPARNGGVWDRLGVSSLSTRLSSLSFFVNYRDSGGYVTEERAPVGEGGVTREVPRLPSIGDGPRNNDPEFDSPWGHREQQQQQQRRYNKAFPAPATSDRFSNLFKRANRLSTMINAALSGNKNAAATAPSSAMEAGEGGLPQRRGTGGSPVAPPVAQRAQRFGSAVGRNSRSGGGGGGRGANGAQSFFDMDLPNGARKNSAGLFPEHSNRARDNPRFQLFIDEAEMSGSGDEMSSKHPTRASPVACLRTPQGKLAVLALGLACLIGVIALMAKSLGVDDMAVVVGVTGPDLPSTVSFSDDDGVVQGGVLLELRNASPDALRLVQVEGLVSYQQTSFGLLDAPDGVVLVGSGATAQFQVPFSPVQKAEVADVSSAITAECIASAGPGGSTGTVVVSVRGVLRFETGVEVDIDTVTEAGCTVPSADLAPLPPPGDDADPSPVPSPTAAPTLTILGAPPEEGGDPAQEVPPEGEGTQPVAP